MTVKNRPDNGNPQGEQPPVTESPSIDTLMDEAFEEVDDEGKPGEGSESGEGDREGAVGGSGEGHDKAKEPTKPEPKRKWGGQFDTPEEMEEAYIKSLRSNEPEPTRRPTGDASGSSAGIPDGKDELPDLTDQELIAMREQDESDGTKFMEEYLRRKMQARNLERHEVAAARKVDAEQGTDLLGDYYELRALRSVRKETAPLVQRSREENQKAFQAREASIDKSNETEFDEGLADLEKFCSNPKNVEQVLQRSPIAHLIIREHESGSPATAHKLLLREAYSIRVAQEKERVQEKKSRSIPADIGGPGKAKESKGSSATVEEAFEESERELGQ